MKICVLASGSKGNSTYIETDNKKILIDIGTTSLYTEKKLIEIGVNPKDIDIILITHTHSDHINGLKVFTKKYKTSVYLTSKMYSYLKDNDILINNYCLLGESIIDKKLSISFIKTSHDVDDSVGYIIDDGINNLVYITDTGYINSKNFELLKNKTVYILESNHDIKKLLDGKYPYPLKQRILGDKGHLSNTDSANYLCKFIGKETKTVILAHLSEENNDKYLVNETFSTVLKEQNIKFNNIIIAEQNERTELIEV